MGDTFLRLIPTDPWWQPTPEAARAAASYVSGVFDGEAVSVETVDVAFHDLVQVIDAGTNTTSVTCSVCRWELGPGFVGQLASSFPEGLRSLAVWVPCCGAVVPVTSHRYDRPIGFARFEVSATNPVRETPWLLGEELERLGTVLGHPVFQVLASS